MQVAIQLEPKDLEAYSAFVNGGKRGLLVQRVFPWILMVGIAGFIAVKLDVVNRPGQIVFPVLIVVMFAFITWRQRAATRKKGSAAFAPMTLTLSDTGLTSEADGRQSSAQWDKIQGYIQAGTYIFIMLDGLTGHIVPLRVFPDVTAKEEFLSVLRARAAELPPPSGWPLAMRTVIVLVVMFLVVGLAWNFGSASR